ncbi:hypothetical protein Dimus_019212 [Dionaea muscipula]
MTGIAIILDLLWKNPSLQSTQTLHSFGLFSAKVAVSAAAASIAASYPFGFRALIGDARSRVAHCDAAPAWSEEDQIPSFPGIHGLSVDQKKIPGFVVGPGPDSSFKEDTVTAKVYTIELKPLFSAFQWKALALTTLRSFLMYYLPLLEPHYHQLDEEDDEDFLQDDIPEEEHDDVDLVTPFKKSLKQIVRESTVVTTRRVLERLAVAYVSQRMAWKLLKYAPKSAMRKAQRGMASPVYFFRVARTTFRAHFLGVAASWIVQVGIDIYGSLSHLFSSKDEIEEDVDEKEDFKLLLKQIFAATLRCSSSLVFASIGAAIGSTFIHPSIGQWVGCAAGDFAGPLVVAVCFDKFFHYN